MEPQNNNAAKRSAEMAFSIDLNEAPISSPREAGNDGVSGSSSISICTVCRKGVPGRRADVETEEWRREFKCFPCLLNTTTNTSTSSRSREGGGFFDINSSPPLDEDVVAATAGGSSRIRGNVGAARTQAPFNSSFASYRSTARHNLANPVMGDIRHILPSPVATESTNARFQDMLQQQRVRPDANIGVALRESSTSSCGSLRATQITPSKYSPESPNMIYLQTLREFIAERSGVLGEGWYVEFEFCNKTYKTSPVYIAPDRSRLKTMEDVARHIGLHPGFLGGGSHREGIKDGFPIQFQDFCLVSAGKVDWRPSYHNSTQIWPIGYRSSWHDRITGSLFVCHVADGGDSGPIFKVQRYPCTRQPIPTGSTILSKKTPDNPVATIPTVGDDDSMSTITLLDENSPPSLETCLSTPKRNELPQEDDVATLSDIIGEFHVEGRSTSSVWEMVSRRFLYACQETYNQKGVVKFCCRHDVHGYDNEDLGYSDSLSKYCFFDGVSIPRLVRNDKEFNTACEMLLIWLNQDRFGLDADFVQEIIEQLPGVSACSLYKNLNERKHGLGLRTVASGFFQAHKKPTSANKLVDAEGLLKRGPCPVGKPLSSSLPSYLLGDALQIWELAWRFSDILGPGQPFSFHELERELVSPWSDCYPLNSLHQIVGLGGSGPSRIEKDLAGVLLAKIFGSLLKLLVSELLLKAEAYAGISKSRRGRKKDFDCLAALKKINLDMLPINGLTWYEIARRYILAVLAMEGNLDSTEIANRESGKVFHCLRGDGGILCGSLTGVAALEGDAVILADATREIFGSLRSNTEIVTVLEGEPNVNEPRLADEAADDEGVIPEWAKVLEPVRKLPTNVGARIRRCINEALEKNPPEWARKMLEHSISKEVYKGNASGPTKRAVVSVLAQVTPEKPQEKAEKKEEKVTIKMNTTDLITKQCRIVLRRATAADEDRVFCNLLGRIVLKPNDNDDEGILGYPAMVSRPLDFRTVDLRLAAGAYGGSHEAFIDDVREVWSNIRTAYGDRADLIDVADTLSKKFEDLYEKEVLMLVRKIDEIPNANDDSSGDAIKERDDLLANIGKSSLPRAPWEEGICKVCGMDRDDDNVLLCDKCDSEYHRYCLNPPLVRIPEGNWYCPSCVAGQSISHMSVLQSRRKRFQGEFTRRFLEKLTRLANLMEMKEYWEFTIEERVFLLKFLFDEALTSATIRARLEQTGNRIIELLAKLKTLTAELKILKAKEEMFGLFSDDKPNSDAESSSRGGKSSGLGKPDDDPSSNEQVDHNSTGVANTSSQPQLPRNDIIAHGQHLQDSIASLELELFKASIRKDLLGRDFNGRSYWAFHFHGARPWIIANGGLEYRAKLPLEFATVPDSDNWMYYESDDEIEKLVGWLKDNSAREKELKESILQLQISKVRDWGYTEKHFISKEESSLSFFSGEKELASSPDVLATKAMAVLEKRFGPRPEIYRCECLELLWIVKDHCSSCHQNFLTNEELRHHLKEDCKLAVSVSNKMSLTNEDVSKSKKLKTLMASQDRPRGIMGNLHASTSGKQKVGFSERYQKITDCPFEYDDIMARFVVPNSIKDRVNEIGLLGNGGFPSFLRGSSQIINDPTLSLGPNSINESGSIKMPTNLRAGRLPRFGENGVLAEERGPAAERLKSILTSKKDQVVRDKSALLGLSRNSIVRESSTRPLVGKASDVLRFLKINLLDMETALPDEALRKSRTNQDRRFVWRAFVKSAKSIYEMVQATVILEDTIKAEYLSNDWWYWSSSSTAAKMTTVAALAFRLYALDSAISYEKPLPSTTTEALEPTNCEMDEDLPTANPSSPQQPQKTPEPETPRTRSRSSSKRKRDMNS